MSILKVPAVPNAPLPIAEKNQVFGEMELRLNIDLGFVENARFDPDVIFYDDDYQNNQSHSPSFSAHLQETANYLSALLPHGGKIVEIGCGKGDFVELLQEKEQFDVIGFDATYEGTNPAIQKRYLTSDDRIDADLVVLRHVLEHIQKPHNFLEMLEEVFTQAQIYIEVPSYEWILQNQTFFDITYEHVNYFSQKALCSLFDDAEIIWKPCFSDQYQFVISDLSLLSTCFKTAYENGTWETQDFASLFPSLSETIRTIKSQCATCKNVYLWGAATKGCMFLVHISNDDELMERLKFTVDINPNKCGKYLPGSLKPIKAPQDFYQQATTDDLLLISNPRYRDEIEADLKDNGLEGITLINL
jgi:predicted small metal-binding protein